jgi:hypothetical protein
MTLCRTPYRSSSVIFLNILSDVIYVHRRNCFFTLQSHMPILHSGPIRCVSWSLLRLGVPLTIPSLLGPLRICPLRTAGTAQRIFRLRAAANCCRDPTPTWVRFLDCRRGRTFRRRSVYRSSNDPRASMSASSIWSSCHSNTASFTFGSDFDFCGHDRLLSLVGRRPIFMGPQSSKKCQHLFLIGKNSAWPACISANRRAIICCRLGSISIVVF